MSRAADWKTSRALKRLATIRRTAPMTFTGSRSWWTPAAVRCLRFRTDRSGQPSRGSSTLRNDLSDLWSYCHVPVHRSFSVGRHSILFANSATFRLVAANLPPKSYDQVCGIELLPRCVWAEL